MDEPKKLTEEDILDKVKKFKEDATAGSVSLFARMRKAEDFKIGNQWDPSTKRANEAKGKFCLTLPIIKPSIKQVVGTETQNPKDFKVRNTKGGSATVAKVLSALAKHATDSEQVIFERTQRFEAGLTSGVGVMGFFIDKSEDPRHGNLRIEKLNEHEVCFDPNCKVYDPNTKGVGCQYIIWEPWVIKEEVEAEYPAKKKELQALGGGRNTGWAMGHIKAVIDYLWGEDTKTSIFGTSTREDVESLQKYRYQESHTWWKEPKRCVLSYDSRKSEIDSVLVTQDDKIARVKKAAERWPDVFSYEDVVRAVMHHTIRVGSVLLEDRVDELNGCNLFPVTRYCPSFDNGYAAGMSEDAIGVQEEINYGRSQTLNIIKQLANTGWIADKYMGTYKEFLEAHGGEDGVILDRSKAQGLEKIDPNPYPVGFERFTEQGIEHAKLVLNVRTEDPTFDTKNMSGKAIALKQHSSLTGSASSFRNHDYTMSIEGNLIVEIIRNVGIYSEDEIRAVVEEEDLIDAELMGQARQMIIQQFEAAGYPIPEQPSPPDMNLLQQFAPEIQQVMMNQYQQESEVFQKLMTRIDEAARPIAEQLLFEEIKKIKKGKYNTKVTLSPMAPTFRIAKSMELFELNETLLKNAQVPISRRLLVEATDVDNKEEIIEEGEKQMAQMAAVK